LANEIRQKLATSIPTMAQLTGIFSLSNHTARGQMIAPGNLWHAVSRLALFDPEFAKVAQRRTSSP